ncbi:MAG: hypothetical protein QXS32_08325 [Candidatus Nezhaarchaeales archaeon]
MSYEEVLRRTLVAAAKEIGTLIRKEELKRQALSASINRPIAENLLQSIESKLATMPDLAKEVGEAMAKAFKEGKPVLETAIEKFVESILKSLPIAITGGLNELKTMIEGVNQQVEVANRILEKINEAGIFTPRLEKISCKDDYMSLFSAMKIAKERLKIIIDFYRELEKVSS